MKYVIKIKSGSFNFLVAIRKFKITYMAHIGDLNLFLLGHIHQPLLSLLKSHNSNMKSPIGPFAEPVWFWLQV
jgi:hypothetical protein